MLSVSLESMFLTRACSYGLRAIPATNALSGTRSEANRAQLVVQSSNVAANTVIEVTLYMNATVNAILCVAKFAESNRNSLMKLDINPLVVLPDGQGVTAADALIRFTSEDS